MEGSEFDGYICSVLAEDDVRDVINGIDRISNKYKMYISYVTDPWAHAGETSSPSRRREFMALKIP